MNKFNDLSRIFFKMRSFKIYTNFIKLYSEHITNIICTFNIYLNKKKIFKYVFKIYIVKKFNRQIVHT